MSNRKTLISKKFEFSASHRYWREEWSKEKNEQVFGLCTSPHGHGHNYELHVTVEGQVDTITGMIAALVHTGMSPEDASVTAAKVNRLAGKLAHPSPATQIGEIIQKIPQAMRECV